MNINQISNNFAFKSNYKFSITSKNRACEGELIDALNRIGSKDDSYMILKEPAKKSVLSPFAVYKNMHISVDDKYDEFIESILNQRNIAFSKQTKAEAMMPENIYKRIVLPKFDKYRELVSLNTAEVEKRFMNERLYVSPNAQSQGMQRKYNLVKEYFSTGGDIDAPKASIFESDGELVFDFIDGAHRFAVMRDLGLDKVKFSLDRRSKRLAKDYGLISD